MKNIWSILCAKSSVDASTNSLSLFDCFDQFTIKYGDDFNLKEKKILPITFEILSLWFDENVKSDRSFLLFVEFFDPSNQKIGEVVKDLVMEKGKRRLRSIIKINQFSITSDGVYFVKVRFKKQGEKKYKTVSDIPFDVKLIKEVRLLS